MPAHPRDIRRYALYGEGLHAIAPEFVHVETIAARSSQHHWTISPHAHPGIFQILVLDAGQGTMLGDTGQTALEPFSLALVPSGSVHAFRFAAGAQGWVLSIADALLHDPRLAPFVTATPFTTAVVRADRIPSDDPLAVRLGWLLADLAAGGRGGETRADRPALIAQVGLVLALAADMLDQDPAPARHAAGHDALVARFRRLVEAHYADGWPVARYAGALAASPPTLTRATRKVLGMPPAAVVQERLLLEAMRLLTYTSSGIAQIADRLGFADPAYFARFFKAQTGTTARGFRAERSWLAASGAAGRPRALPPGLDQGGIDA